jgi:putative endonuclease
MEHFDNKHLKTGQVGELLVVDYLKKEGFKVLDRNYSKPFGEIDIVAERRGNIHFVEVKTMTRDIFYVNRGTSDDYEPEDKMHLWKRQRLSRAILVYLNEKGIGEDSDWQCDLYRDYVDQDYKLIKIEVLEDVILS